MKRYPSYKDSGVEWIGEIPEHWENRKFKWDIFYQEGPGLRTFQFTDKGVRVICVSNITEKGIDFETTHTRHISFEDYLEKYQHFTVDDKDILLSSSGSIGKVSRYFFDGDPVILNTSTIRLHSSNKGKYLDDFVPYLLSSDYIQIQLRFLMTGGIVSNFGPSHLDQLFNYLPPLSEQTQIVSYLDRKTEGIDKLIQNKIRKIELLKEYRTSLISKVVTKGLNPNVKMKDSGVEWIGEIPEHWGVKNIKHHSEVNVGLVINPSTYFDEYGTIPIITGKNVKVTGIDLGEVDKITEESNELLWKTKIYEDDLVSMRVGYPGRTSVVKKSENGINCCSVIITRKSKSIISKLLELQLNSKIGEIQVELCQGGMGQKVVNLSDWNEFKVISPPLSEQHEIVSYLDEQTQLIDKNIQTEEKKIELLKEYRQSLISEVVTGKIKVSNDEEVH